MPRFTRHLVRQLVSCVRREVIHPYQNRRPRLRLRVAQVLHLPRPVQHCAVVLAEPPPDLLQRRVGAPAAQVECEPARVTQVAVAVARHEAVFRQAMPLTHGGYDALHDLAAAQINRH